ncbi:MAG: hypothetical protein IJW37_05175 [Lachnospiraceae bacterium]|nr:hypothetical protein [Lachnospiraceae bacterium]
MKKNNTAGIVLGLLFLVIGAGYLAEVLGFIDHFTIFFDGWWSLFIIVPCFCGLLGKSGDKIGYLIGIAIGLFFLLSAQDVIDSDKLFTLLIAGVFVLIGVNLILPKKKKEENDDRETGHYTDRFDRGTTESAGAASATSYTTTADGVVYEDAPTVTVEPGTTSDDTSGRFAQSNSSGFDDKIVCSAVFAGRDIHVDNSTFGGADLSAFFGGIDMNLKNAIVTRNTTIEVKAAFGGISLIMPPNVRVVVDVTPILGGVDNGARTPLGADENTPTIYVKGTCMFGGVEIK